MIVYCEIMNYLLVPGAEHWYANLVCRPSAMESDTRLELKRTLTESGAARLNRREGGDWEAGEETNKFFTEEAVKEEAIRRYKLMFPDAVMLVDGRDGVCDPQPILDGPPKVMTTANRFVQRAHDIGWWEGGDEAAMRVLCDEWDEFWEPLRGI